MIAVALGYLMSHCLVLAAFNSRVQQQMGETRQAKIEGTEKKFNEKIKPVNERLARAQGVASIADNSAFLSAYKGYNQTNIDNASATPEKSEPLDSDPLSSDSTLRAIKASILQQATSYATEKATREGALQAKQAEFDRYEGDLKMANVMYEKEVAGIKVVNISFATPEFKVLGAETSGKEGVSKKATEMKKVIDVWERDLPDRKTALEKERADLKAFSEKNDGRQDEMQKQAAAREKDLLSTASASLRSQHNNVTSEADSLRTLLKADITSQTAQRDKLVEQYNIDRAPFAGKGFDLIEQSVALHKLIFTRDADGDSGQQVVMLSLVVALMLCLMFLDLTPLMMKLLQAPSLVDEIPITLPSQQQHSPASSGPGGGRGFGGGAPPPQGPPPAGPRVRPEPPVSRPR
jgi:hypothetical protein